MNWSKSYRFTSFRKNRGTDLLIFFRWSGSENKEEVGDGTDETKGGLIRGKESVSNLKCTFDCWVVFTITGASDISSRVLPSFLSCYRQNCWIKATATHKSKRRGGGCTDLVMP